MGEWKRSNIVTGRKSAQLPTFGNMWVRELIGDYRETERKSERGRGG